MWITHPAGGADLGREAMRAVVRAELGLAPATALSAALLAVHELPDVETMLRQATRRESRFRHAAAARVVLAAAAAGDRVATALVADQAGALADQARVAAGRVGYRSDDALPVVLGGSVALAAPMNAMLCAAIGARLPAAAVVTAVRPPVLGAVLQALAEDGERVTAELAARLDAAPLPEDFLLT